LTTRQYARLVSEWVRGISFDPLKIATHSMRRTKVTLIYRRAGNLRAAQLLLADRKHRPLPRCRSRRCAGNRRENRRLKYLGRAAALCPPPFRAKVCQELSLSQRPNCSMNRTAGARHPRKS
jgi:hypothetical protein